MTITKIFLWSLEILYKQDLLYQEIPGKSHHRNCTFYDNTQYFEIRNFYMEKILTDFWRFSVQDESNPVALFSWFACLL